jgi:lysophospholipase L1-like esterase
MYWYEEEVERLEKEIAAITYEPKLVFYGSSTIRLWDSLQEDFKRYDPMNLGFGGSTLEACVYFFKRLMRSLHPKYLIIYAGDNDLGDGKTPAEVHGYFVELCNRINKCFGNLPLSYVSIKPSPSRWQINGAIQKANCLIKNTIEMRPNMHFVDVYSKMLGDDGRPVVSYYDADGLHLSEAGYEVWRAALLTHISLIVDMGLISAA